MQELGQRAAPGIQKLLWRILLTAGPDGSKNSIIVHKNNQIFRYKTTETDTL